MPRKRDPRRDEAFNIFKKAKGKIKLKDLASELNVSEGTVRGWKNKDEWNNKLIGTLQTKIRNVPNKRKQKKARVPSVKKESEAIAESGELTDKQRLFCLYYVKYWNATKAYQKAYECSYESATANAWRLMENEGIKNRIDIERQRRSNKFLLDDVTVIQKYIDIAFADITDYLAFGRKEVVVDHTEDGKPIRQEINYVDFKNSDNVDGTIVDEVKQGRDGISIKLTDRMKALEKLEKYFNAIPDRSKDKSIELMQAKIEQAKAEAEKTKRDLVSDDGEADKVIINENADEMRRQLNDKREHS